MAGVEDLTVRAKVQDELSAPVKHMRGELEHLSGTVEKVGDASLRTARKTDAMNGSWAKSIGTAPKFRTAADIIKTSLAGIAAVAAGASIGKFFTGSIAQSSKLSETVNASSVIFGKNAKSMEKWAAGAATSAGLSKQAALEAATGFGDMFSQIGFGQSQAAAMSKDVVQLAADLGSFKNLPTADVSDMISAALRGEYDSLQRVIPNINAARVEHEALAATGKTSVAALTAQEKAAATLAIIHKDGARAAGDFARTQGSAANQAKIATAKFQNLQSALGDKLIPAVTKLVIWINDKGIPGLMKFGHAVDNNKGKIAAVGIAIGVLTGLVWAYEVSQKAAAAGGLAKYLVQLATSTKIVSGLTKAYTAFQWLLNAAFWANPITWVVAGIAALAVGLVIAYKKSATFREAVDKAWGSLKKAWEWAVKAKDAIVNFFDTKDAREGPSSASGSKSLLIDPGATAVNGDTRTQRGYGHSHLGATVAAHAGVSAALGGGYGISNALVGGGGHGHGSGDHQAGRAVDVVGRNLPAYAREVRRRGGYAAIHGQGGGKHVHAVMGDTSTRRHGRMDRGGAGGGGVERHYTFGDININVPNGDPRTLKDAMKQVIRELERDAREMAD